jgi:hypothetical protein
MQIDHDQLGRSIALHQERLRMPTLSKEDGMVLSGRDSSSAWYGFLRRYGVQRLSGGRVRRKDLEAALKKESLGQ